ncbi:MULTISPECIES: hypothetical protein [unclassified Mammaliicoccus]|nr:MULTISPECIES: hypothetical protein [unclassified Mammaliicoccus]
MSVVLLSGCTISIGGDSNDDKSSENAQKSESQDNQSNGSENNNSNKDESNDGNNHESNQDNNTSNENTNSDEYYAKVWLTALPSYRNMDESEMNADLQFHNLEGEYLNPYNKANTVKYPKGMYLLAGSPTAAGQVVYKNNGDGTISIYNVPSHFQDRRWLEDDEYSQQESEKILNNPKVVKLYDASDEQIAKTVKMFNGSTSMNDGSDSDSDDDSNSEKVTRENVIDKVESYEGSLLDTDKYTYKEPEKTDEGKWGFSFEDKDGNLAGSYIIDDDGKVTEYDENGEEVGSGY